MSGCIDASFYILRLRKEIIDKKNTKLCQLIINLLIKIIKFILINKSTNETCRAEVVSK